MSLKTLPFACVYEKYSTQLAVLASRHAPLCCIFRTHTRSGALTRAYNTYCASYAKGY